MTLPRLLLTLFCAHAGLAIAQTSPWYLGISQGFAHDSNLYRLADGAAVPGGLSRSDTVSTTTLLGGLRQPLGRQTLRADATLRASRFNNNKSLDNEGGGLKLGLDWATVGRVSGLLQLNTDRNLVRFNSDSILEGGFERNIATATQLDASVRVGLVTRWSAELAASHQRVDYSAAAFASREYRQNSLSAGLRYTPSPALSLGASLRGTNGRYPRFALAADGSTIGDRYEGRFVDWTARWSPTAASQFDARISLGRTDFDRATASDVSGLTGQLGWTWRPTGKLRLDTRLSRDRGQDSSMLYFTGSGRFADYSRTTSALSLAANYELSSKIALTAGWLYADRKLVDTRQDLFGATFVRFGDDQTTLVTLGARWAPTRSVTLGCDIGREQRRHDGPLSTDYSVNTASCFGQFTLQ